MEFRILGPLQVELDSGPLRLANSREQKILATLLVDAERTVPLARLVDAVWGDRPPPSADKSLRNCVSALRGRFAAAGARDQVIGTEPAGYVLRIGDGWFDLRAFTDHVARGRELAAAGQLEAAVTRLRQALALWRGAALAGMTGQIIEAAAARLDEQRLTVHEECLSHELALGRAHELVDELSALIAAQPLRERPRGQLMLALHRSGRRPEALQVYRQTDRLLRQELGIEPSDELAALHQAILTGDRRLDAETAAATTSVAGATSAAITAATADRGHAPPESGQVRPTPTERAESRRTEIGRPVPAQLPADPRGFTGRVSQLAALDGLLRADGATICALSGTAGVGKTTLAVHWAHRVRAEFPDGQLYVNLRGFDPSGAVMSPAEALKGFLDALGVPPQHIPATLATQTGLYRSLLVGRRMLIVLDNARTADQVRPLLPGEPGCLVVVTSRDRLAGLVATDGAQPLALDLLSTVEARHLLASRIGEHRIAAEPHAAAELITMCARLPLALAITAARAATSPGFSLADLAAELRDTRGSLDAFADEDPAANVRAVFSWSYHALSDGAARLFRLLGLHPGPDIATPAAASLAGSSRDQVRSQLAELTRAHLVAEHAPGRYSCHELLRAYAGDRARLDETEAERRAALHRVLDHYLHTTHTAARLLNPHRDQLAVDPPSAGTEPEWFADHRGALAWFEAEHPVLVTALALAAGTGFDAHVALLPWGLDDYFDRRGHWRDWITTQQAALAAAERLGDREGQARAHRSLGIAHARLGSFAEADTHFEAGLRLFRELGNRIGEAHTHLSLCWTLDRQDRWAEALDHTQQALALYRAAGHHPVGEARALNDIGWYHARLGNYEQALHRCRQALDLFHQLGHRTGAADALDSLGYAHHHLGDHEHAIACYGEALTLLRELGDQYNEAVTLTRLGDAQHAAGEPDAALKAWKLALTIFDQLDHPAAYDVRDKIAGVAQARSARLPADDPGLST